jgi:hypothetical protein
MKRTKQSVIGVHLCSFTGNEICVHSPEMECTKPSYRCLHLRKKHVGKKHYLFQRKDFDRSKKLSQFTFNGQNGFFLANTLRLNLHSLSVSELL